jgi:hypothetical protein
MTISRKTPLLGQPTAERFPFGALADSKSRPRRSVMDRSGTINSRVRIPGLINDGAASVRSHRSSFPLFVGFESGSLVSLTLLQVLLPVGIIMLGLGGPWYRQSANHPPGEQRDYSAFHRRLLEVEE